MTSIRTTEAAAAASAARRDYREHLDNCPECSTARHRRQRPQCRGGGMLRAALQAAENRLRYEREQDRKPSAGQQPLWPTSAR